MRVGWSVARPATARLAMASHRVRGEPAHAPVPPACPDEIGHEHEHEGAEDHDGGCSTLPDLPALEEIVVDEDGRDVGGDARSAGRERQHQVKGLDGELEKHHQYGCENRLDLRQNDLAVDTSPT